MKFTNFSHTIVDAKDCRSLELVDQTIYWKNSTGRAASVGGKGVVNISGQNCASGLSMGREDSLYKEGRRSGATMEI